MLGDYDAMATIAVKNLKAARKFYEGTLGFKAVHTEGDEAVTYKSGKSQLSRRRISHSDYFARSVGEGVLCGRSPRLRLRRTAPGRR